MQRGYTNSFTSVDYPDLGEVGEMCESLSRDLQALWPEPGLAAVQQTGAPRHDSHARYRPSRFDRTLSLGTGVPTTSYARNPFDPAQYEVANLLLHLQTFRLIEIGRVVRYSSSRGT
jgi:hypothetical protein